MKGPPVKRSVEGWGISSSTARNTVHLNLYIHRINTHASSFLAYTNPFFLHSYTYPKLYFIESFAF